MVPAAPAPDRKRLRANELIASRLEARNTRRLAMFLGGHVAIGVAIHVMPALSTLHALACVAAGVFIATFRGPRDVAFALAYITGSEVLWRMTEANVFHEMAKYAISLVVLIALVRMSWRRNRIVALAYIGFLLPSAILTLLAPDIDAREQISFNLSGPFTLTLCVLFFSSVRLTTKELRGVFFSVIAPVLSISTLLYFSTAAVKEIEFTNSGNFVTSGGFGPNQVSAILGLALMFAILMLLDRTLSRRVRLGVFALSGLFAVQAALTFSRGGLFLALLGALAAMAYLMRDARTRITLIILVSVCFGVANFLIIPRLEDFTNGKIGERYTNTNSNGRTRLAAYDLEIFEDNPVLGVGPGVAPLLRKDMGHFGAAHTEYTRMVAEHGVFGVLAGLMLCVLGIRAIRQARTLKARAFVVAMLLWVMGDLGINAMRLAAPSFLFGLACAVSYSSLPQKSSLKRAKAGKRGLTGADAVAPEPGGRTIEAFS